MNKPDSTLLEGLLIVDLSVGMATALVSKYFADNGARVVKVDLGDEEAVKAFYPAYSAWYRKSEYVALSAGEIDSLLGEADACILGGESFPGVDRSYDAVELASRFPGLIILDVTGNPHGIEGTRRPSTDILAQARSGLCYEHFSDRPIVMGFEPANYGATLQSLVGLLAALYEKAGTGRGQIVHTSLLEGCLTWVMQIWGSYEKPAPSTTPPLKDLHPLIFQCADGVWVHVVLGSAGSKYKLYTLLGIDDPSVKPGDSGMPDPSNPDRRNYFGDIDLLSEYIGKFASEPLLDAMRQEGLAVEVVRAPGECWDSPQVQHNGMIDVTDDGGRHVGNPLIVHGCSASPTNNSSPGRLLRGVRALDFGAFVAGPLATRILADFGASVTKVEPLAGDPARAMTRSYVSSNSGKRGLALDLKAGGDITRQLLAQVDVVTNNFRSGVSGRLGVDPASLHQIDDNIICLESPGYGSAGPQARQAAFDLVMQAVCGHEAKGGGEGNTPFWNRTYMVDFAGGFLGAIALLTALNHRARQGGGASLEVPLLNAGVFLLSELVQDPDGNFRGIRQLNNAQTGYKACEAIYKAKDGWLAIVARSDEQKKALAGVLGEDSLTFHDRRDVIRKDFEIMEKAIARFNRAELASALEGKGVWVEVCNDKAEDQILGDPQYHRRGTVKITSNADFGTVREIAALVTFTPPFINDGVPGTSKLGEHTDAILGEAGFAGEEIARLRREGVVG